MREKIIDIITAYADFLPWETIDAIADNIIADGFTIPDRCKDCKHRNDWKCPYTQYTARGGLYSWAKDDDFCSRGERREGE